MVQSYGLDINLKGGDPSAPSSTDTLLRLNPHRWIHLDPAKSQASGALNFADLTGSVCKRRERIHRALLMRDYYQFRVRAGEFQPAVPTEGSFVGLAPSRDFATHCTSHCRMCVALDISIMLTWHRPLLPPNKIMLGSLRWHSNTG